MDLQNSKIAQAKTEHEILMEDPKSAKSVRRADKRRRRKYKFSDKSHPKMGITASLLIIPGTALIACAIIYAASMKGHGGYAAGLLIFFSLLISTLGIIFSALTFKKTDTIYTFSWIGLIGNIIIWLFNAFTIAAGL